MADLKHVGRLTTNNRKIIVAYKVVPGEPENCIVVTTENLDAEQHDTLMNLVESSAGQESNDLADAMARTRLPDGRVMLSAFHTQGKMVKVPTTNVELTPNRNTSIKLSELNEIIAQQRGVTVADLAPGGATAQPTSTTEQPQEAVEAAPVTQNSDPLSDEDLAAKYRSDADRLFKEAKRLREQAEELSPTKRKTKKTEESA